MDKQGVLLFIVGLLLVVASSIPYYLHFGMDFERFLETLALAIGVACIVFGFMRRKN